MELLLGLVVVFLLGILLGGLTGRIRVLHLLVVSDES